MRNDRSHAPARTGELAGVGADDAQRVDDEAEDAGEQFVTAGRSTDELLDPLDEKHHHHQGDERYGLQEERYEKHDFTKLS